MIRKIGKTVGTIIGGIIPAFTLMIVMSSIAWAINSTSPITLENGTIGFDSTATLSNDTSGTAGGLSTALVITSGGTGVAAIADNQLFVGSGTNTVAVGTLTDCPTGGISFTASGNTFGCTAIPSDSTIASILAFQSETKIDVDTAATNAVYIGAGGRVSTSVGEVQTVFYDAANLNNLACTISADPTANLTVVLLHGVCNTLGTTSTTQTLTFANSDTAATVRKVGAAVADAAIAAGECAALKVSSDANPDAVFVNCAIEKVS